jgi:hypothetical protein
MYELTNGREFEITVDRLIELLIVAKESETIDGTEIIRGWNIDGNRGNIQQITANHSNIIFHT